MESLSTFKHCLHPAPIKFHHVCKSSSCSSRRLSTTIKIQSRRCLNFSEPSNYLKPGSSGQLWLTGFEDKARKRSVIQVTKASEPGAPLQSEEAAPVVTVEEKDKEGVANGKYWVLRCASEGEAKSQKIVPGDGLLVGAAPNVTGSAKPFVVDIPSVSSSHARVYGKERKSHQTTVHEYFVMDLGSTNGTYLNRSKLRPNTEVKLSRGDTLKFGDEKATFVVEAQD